MSRDGHDADLPTIAYVDESKDELSNFYGDALDSGYFGEIILVEPEEDLDQLIANLLDLNIDALVSDFNLSDDRPNAYNGADVVEGFLAKRRYFPCFIRTSFDQDAMGSSSDVNRIYSKNAAEEIAVGRDLFKRVSIQIHHHRAQIEAWSEEFAQLLAIPAPERTSGEIDRLIELDDFLERSFAADQALAMTAKREVLDREGLFAKQNQLVEQTEKLIAAMKATLG